MRVKRTLVRMFLAAAVAVSATAGAVVVAEKPAAASTSCYGDYCSGKDPATTTTPDGHSCSDGAQTIQSTDVYAIGGGLSLGAVSINLGGGRIGTIELRWSWRCQTNWARLNLAQGAHINTIGVRQDPTHYEQVGDIGPMGNLPPGVYWTKMIYSPVLYCQAFVHKDLFWWYATNWD